MKQTTFSGGDIFLRPLVQEDMEPIRRWRNEQISILRQTRHLTKEDQRNYWKHVLVPSFTASRPTQVLFAILKDQVLIGYGGITHIDWQRHAGELSFLVNSGDIEIQTSYRLVFGQFLDLIKKIAFNYLNIERLFAETYDLRPDHVFELEKHGFLLEKRIKGAVNIGKKQVDSLIHGCQLNGR